MSAELETEILRLLVEACGEPLARLDMDLLENGLLDSLGLAEFLEAVEDRWGVEIYPTKYTRMQLSTPKELISLITALVEKQP